MMLYLSDLSDLSDLSAVDYLDPTVACRYDNTGPVQCRSILLIGKPVLDRAE